MQNGTLVDRQWISVLMDGRLVLDWGEGLVQDILSGDFVFVDKSEYSHPIRDDELDILVRAGRVERFDTRQVSIFSLPEFPRRTIK